MDRISHYRVLGRIGSGGMGEVYRAVDERLGREVAIKLLKSTGSGSAERQVRLLREAQAASALNHPGIVTVYDVGTHDDRPFLVMELVEGRRLSDLRNVAPTEALLLCAQAADALAAAHARGILHRDIKSDNLMVLPDGRVKVLDFGLAKLSSGGTSSTSGISSSGQDHSADPLGDTIVPDAIEPSSPVLASPSPLGVELTRIGDVIGTPAYMAPEQTEGKPAEARSEVFSLGVVLYELLVGRRPFVGATVGETLELVRSRDPVPPSAAADKPILRRIDAVVMRALAKSPEARYADMQKMAAELRRAAGRLQPVRRGRLLATALAFAIIATAGVVTLRSRPRLQRAIAPIEGSIRPLTRQEGCEEFPSFTADGRAVLYDASVARAYALFQVPIEGGEPRRLTAVTGWDLAPAVSPDGTRLLFLRKENAPMGTWVASFPRLEDARLVAPGSTRPAWSPDGRHVWTGGGGGLVRRDAATLAPVRTITAPDGERPLMVRELRDGRVVVLFLPRSGNVTADAVGVYGREGSDIRWLLRGADLEEVLAPTPSGDAVLIAQHTASENIELARLPLDGGPPRRLGLGDVAARKGLAFAPDGKRMVWSNCRAANSLALLERDANGRAHLTDLAQNDWEDVEPAVIPGSDDMLVVSDRGGEPSLWRVDRWNRRAASPLGVGKDASTVAVSPDGKQVAFGNDEGVWVAPLGGGAAPRKLTDAQSDSPPSFRRDGRALFFEGIDEQKRPRIGEVPTDGGEPRWIASPGRAPAASPVEDVLVYLEPSGDGVVPLSLDLRTGKKQPISTALAARAWTGLRFSPDGKRLLFLRSSGELAVIEARSGRVEAEFDAGADLIRGGTFIGNELVVGRTVWRGDLWIADLK